MDLTGYMAKSSNKYKTPGNVINCYDQAAAVCSFGTLLGIDVEYKYLRPFGYINTINIVGRGNSNNPFYGYYNTSKMIGVDDSSRSGFGNHAFAVFNGYVFDACAGPALGTQTEAQYMSDTIDTATANKLYATGTVSDIISGAIDHVH